MSSQPRYQPVRNLDADGSDIHLDDSLAKDNRPYKDDDEADGPPLTRGQRHGLATTFTRPAGLFTCRRLSKACIALIVLVFAVLVSIVGGSAYWAYSTAYIDGQSPPWYPSPPGGTVSRWQDSYDKAQKMVEKMTLVEKVNITTGLGWGMGLCVGNTGPATNVGFPSLCLQDGPLGIRFADHATSFPAGITVGATWNRDLMRQRGVAHARQAKMKGIHVLLGPAMGPLGRNPAGGRVWEGFGSDPVLQAVAAYETIQGIQSEGVMATAKHFVGNEQEHFRKSFEWGLPEALSSNIDDRAMHEIYAWPFAESIRAGVASIMCSYQMVNNSYACQNSKLMNGILKDELGFQGFVQSDWLAQRSGVASALAGLDMSMPGDGLFWKNGNPLFGNQLTIAVLNSTVPVTRVNDMATRIVAAWYQLGQDSWSSDGPNFSSWTDEKVGKLHDGASDSRETGVVNQFVEAEDDKSKAVARSVAAEGTVLLKNDDEVLPLSKKMTSKDGARMRVMVVGEDAGPGKGPNACDDRACNQGTLAVGWGSGATEFTYLVDPLSAINSTISNADLTAHLSNHVSESLEKDLRDQDLCIVFANADAGEGHQSWGNVRADRNDLDLQKDGSALIQQVGMHCGGPVVVVLHSVGPVIVEEFVDLPQVKAILLANLPGQESGNALADVLFGDVDASGRLPYTMGKSLEDYGTGAPVLYYPNGVIPQVDFKEGLYIDYRHFDKYNIEPRYPFGHGLSYTTFELSDLKVITLREKSALPALRPDELVPPTYDEIIPDIGSALYPSGFRKLSKYIYPYIKSKNQVKQGKYPYPAGYDTAQSPSQAGGGEGGNPSLFEQHVQVEVGLSNTGDRKGKEVVQLYVSFPTDVVESSTGESIDVPTKVLRNFDKVELSPGESQTVSLNLTRKDLSYWSTVQQNWVMPSGEFTLSVGRSSRDLVLHGKY